jgi:hypothetical protein
MARSIGGYVGIGNPILAPDAPFAAPTNAGPMDAEASFDFVAPENEGLSSVTLYVIIAITGGAIVAAGTSASSPISVSGLTNGTAYTFIIFAINGFGVGPGSPVSSAVTPIAGAGRGLSFGGTNNPGTQAVDMIEFCVLATTGNTSDFGDLSAATYDSTGFSSTTRGCMRVSSNNTTSYIPTLEYVTVATTGNTTDFGDTTLSINAQAACSNNTRGLVQGGRTESAPAGNNVIDYFTISSTGDATDFGDLSATRLATGACASPTRGITSMGGDDNSGTEGSNIMDYVTIASTGNASDFGDLTTRLDSSYSGAASSSTRGVVAGGRWNGTGTDQIEYITIASTGNSADFGNLVQAMTEESGGAASNNIRAAWFGGVKTSGGITVDIGYTIIATLGDALDFGDLNGGGAGAGAPARKRNGALGSSHGGVQ